MKLQYLLKSKLYIPYLKSKGGTSLNLPLFDYSKMQPLPLANQIIVVSDNEGKDLLRVNPSAFKIIEEVKNDC